MKYLLLPLIAATPLLFSQCNKVENAAHDATQSVASSGDFSLAKSTFEGLTKGDTEVAKNIDWEMLTTPEGDYGAKYNLIPTETEKIAAQKTFILDFASAYQKSGGATYSNWKVSFHDETKTEVTADQPNGRLVIVVTQREGKERVSSLRFLQ